MPRHRLAVDFRPLVIIMWSNVTGIPNASCFVCSRNGNSQERGGTLQTLMLNSIRASWLNVQGQQLFTYIWGKVY